MEVRKMYWMQSLGDYGFLEGTAFPVWRAVERRWNKMIVSLMSSVILVMHLPISYVICMAISYHAPAVSTAKEQKKCILLDLAYLSVFCAICGPLYLMWSLCYYLHNKRWYVYLFICLSVADGRPNGWVDQDQTWHRDSCWPGECFRQGQGHLAPPGECQ